MFCDFGFGTFRIVLVHVVFAKFGRSFLFMKKMSLQSSFDFNARSVQKYYAIKVFALFEQISAAAEGGFVQFLNLIGSEAAAMRGRGRVAFANPPPRDGIPATLPTSSPARVLHKLGSWTAAQQRLMLMPLRPSGPVAVGALKTSQSASNPPGVGDPPCGFTRR